MHWVKNEQAWITGFGFRPLFCNFSVSHSVSNACARTRNLAGGCAARNELPFGGFADIPAIPTRKGSPGSTICLRRSTRFGPGRICNATARASLRLRFSGRELGGYPRVPATRRQFAGSGRTPLHASRLSQRVRLASARLQRAVSPAVIHGSVPNHAGV